MALQIDRDDRDVLHAAAIDSLGDIAAALTRDDYQRARWLRPRLEGVMRLLDDIGWGQQNPGELFELTLDNAQLALAVQYLVDRIRERTFALMDQGAYRTGSPLEDEAAFCTDSSARRRSRTPLIVEVVVTACRRHRAGRASRPVGIVSVSRVRPSASAISTSTASQ